LLLQRRMAPMNRGVFLSTLAGGFLLSPRLEAALTPVEKMISELLDEAVDAQFTFDFPRLAGLLHPASMSLFRDQLSARFDEAMRTHTFEEVSAVSGLPAHPKDMSIPDAEFFVLACQNARAKHPEFVGEESYLPLRILGMIFDTPQHAHVLMEYTGAVRTERTSFDFGSTTVLTVRRERQRWQVYSCLLARRITDNWWRDLAKKEEAVPGIPVPNVKGSTKTAA